jgi:hypothetical protein
MTITAALATAYVLGALVGLLRIDGSLPTKVGLALTWPLGLLAFLVTIGTLLGVAAVAFPVFGMAMIALLLMLAWLWP